MDWGSCWIREVRSCPTVKLGQPELSERRGRQSCPVGPEVRPSGQQGVPADAWGGQGLPVGSLLRKVCKGRTG